LEQAKEKWRRAIDTIRRQKSGQAHAVTGITADSNGDREQQRKEEQEKLLYQEAVKEILERDDDVQSVSPFIIARLAVVLRKEYQAHLLEKNVDRLHEEQKDVVNWVCEGIQSAEKGEKMASDEGIHRIVKAKLDLENDSLEYTRQCQSFLQQRRQEILRKLQKLQDPSLVLECDALEPDHNHFASAHDLEKEEEVTLSSSSEWLEDIIDENYFPAASLSEETSAKGDQDCTASDWVICGY
jgi:hypothetical protein